MSQYSLKIDSIQKYKVLPSHQGSITLTVTNTGTTSGKGQPPVYVNLFAGPDRDLSFPLDTRNLKLEGTDELLAHVHRDEFNNLEPGESVQVTLRAGSSELKNPSVVSPGSYYIIGEVSTKQKITERDPANNQLTFRHYSEPGADLVLKWNATLNNILQDVNHRPVSDPPYATRAAAIMHAAIYDAVNAFDRQHAFYYVNTPASDTVGADERAAIIGAGYEALVNLYDPSKIPGGTKAGIKDAEAEKKRDLAALKDSGVDEAAIEKGFALGKSIADKLLTARADDGSATADDATFTASQPGDWQPTPPNFERGLEVGWGRVTPFAIPSVDSITKQVGANGNPAVDSPEYKQQIDETQSLGQDKSTTRTREQTLIADFWAVDRRDTARPPAQILLFLTNVSLQQHLSLEDNARFFALETLAEADAGIAAWDLKWTYHQFRPLTSIREGFSSHPDPNWNSRLQNPPFPDYVSGHSTFAGAAFTAAKDFFGTDNISFAGTSQDVPQTVRSFNSFSEAANEDRDSRIYGGVHTRSAVNDGQNVGIAIGDYVFNNALAPGQQ